MTKEVTGLALLRQPFPPHQISKLPKPLSRDAKKGKCDECGGYHGLPAIHLDYVGHAALTDRLLDCDPQWSWEPLAINDRGLPALDSNGGLWIRLTVCGTTRLGYGHAGDKKGGDAIKEVIGDALRNAAMRFGAALDLWHKGDLHLDDEEADQGQSQRGAVSPDPRPANITLVTDEQMVRIQSLVQATNSNVGALCKAARVDNLEQLSARKADKVIERLEAKLAEMAKAETNSLADELDEDSIPY